MCDSCQVMRINGVVCHETGCPKDYRTECSWCGSKVPSDSEFKSLVRSFCDESCYCAYYNLPNEEIPYND